MIELNSDPEKEKAVRETDTKRKPRMEDRSREKS